MNSIAGKSSLPLGRSSCLLCLLIALLGCGEEKRSPPTRVIKSSGTAIIDDRTVLFEFTGGSITRVFIFDTDVLPFMSTPWDSRGARYVKPSSIFARGSGIFLILEDLNLFNLQDDGRHVTYGETKYDIADGIVFLCSVKEADNCSVQQIEISQLPVKPARPAEGQSDFKFLDTAIKRHIRALRAEHPEIDAMFLDECCVQ